jgi:hypothetical protein
MEWKLWGNMAPDLKFRPQQRGDGRMSAMKYGGTFRNVKLSLCLIN